MAKTGHFLFRSTPLCLGVELCLGGPETGTFSGSPRRSNAPPRRTCKLCFYYSFPLSLTIVPWINENRKNRGGKIGPTRWASSVRPKLGPGWAIKLLARKKSGQIWPGPVWPSPIWPGPATPIFFCLENTIWPDRSGF